MNRVAVVTGGASGLWPSVCQHLAHQGCRVGVLDLDAEAAERRPPESAAPGIPLGYCHGGRVHELERAGV